MNLNDIKYLINAIDREISQSSVCEFFEGNSGHLQKANDRLKQLNTIAEPGELGLDDWDVIDALRLDLENAIKLFD